MSRKSKAIIQFFLFFGIVIILNILGNLFYGNLDLTEEKRFTLTQPTKKLLQNLDERVYVRVLLEGDFPAGFKRIQNSVRETLEDFRDVSNNIEYSFENPLEGTVSEINAKKKELNKLGLIPMNMQIQDVGEKKDMIVYPYAIMNYKGREVFVNIFESDPAIPQEVQINNSVSQLEYQFANGIQKLQISIKPTILFTAGNGELGPLQTADIRKSLAPYYNTGPIFLDSITQINTEVACLIIAKPTRRFSEKDQFKIDQYLMNGGKVIWLIDQLGVSLDSIRKYQEFIPLARDLNLDEMLFNYGVRIHPNLVLDLSCAKIPLKVDQRGQIEMKDWFYHPIIIPRSKHPIVKNLDGISTTFPSTIDTIRTKTPVEKTILLSSSQRSRYQVPPGARLNFEITRYKVDPSKFNKGPQPVAVLLEGTFPSFFNNRVTNQMMEGLNEIGQPFKAKSVDTKMLIVSDGDMIKNLVLPNRQTRPLGYDQYMRYTFANKDFLINAIEYLIDDSGVIVARAKEVKLRPLDTVKISQEKTKWQLINLVLPLVFLGIFGFVYRYLRKRRYAGV